MNEIQPTTFVQPTQPPSLQQAANILELPLDDAQRHFSERDLAASWCAFWFFTWLGTTLAGSAFGLVLGVIAVPTGTADGLIVAPIIGCIYAGSVGFIVICHIAIFCWMFWLQRRPLQLASIAGGITGCVCGAILFFVTGPFGAAGAYFAIKKFLKSEIGQPLVVAERHRRRTESQQRNFSLSELFWRVTVTAMVLAGWAAVWRAYR